MKIVSMSDYMVELAQDLCLEKFDNDIMLIFNNFTKEAKQAIVSFVKEDMNELIQIGLVFDHTMVKVCSSMYLGLGWSMYRKGKAIQKEKSVFNQIIKNGQVETYLASITNYLASSNAYNHLIEDMASRYYTLYFSKYSSDMFYRMDIAEHPLIENKDELEALIQEYLKVFGLRVLARGIYDQYIKLRK